jgi:hypothetical protein
MKIPCSNCNQRLEIPDELAGQTIECPSCNASLAVPPPAPAQVQESAPQAASSKKSKLSIPKWAIASVAGIAVVVVGLIMFFPDDSNGVLPSEPTAVKTDGESQQSAPSPETKPVEPVAEAAKAEPTTAKAPDISIHKAAANGNIEAVKQHIAAGTDVNAKNKFGVTPLNYAAQLGRKEIVELLIAKGADVNAKDDDGTTPLHGAAGDGHKEIAEQLVDKGADLNAKNDGGFTPLYAAAVWGHKEIIELLITAGADVNVKGVGGITPLDSAIFLNRTETADLLRKHGGKTGEELKAEGK